jgi:hypothetical protein
LKIPTNGRASACCDSDDEASRQEATHLSYQFGSWWRCALAHVDERAVIVEHNSGVSPSKQLSLVCAERLSPEEEIASLFQSSGGNTSFPFNRRGVALADGRLARDLLSRDRQPKQPPTERWHARPARVDPPLLARPACYVQRGEKRRQRHLQEISLKIQTSQWDFGR